MNLLLALWACWGADAYIVEGVVVRVDGEHVVLDHEDIPGLMPAMVMPFAVDDPLLLETLRPGDHVLARYHVGDGGGRLMKVRVTGHGPAPAESTYGPAPITVGEALPPQTLLDHRGADVLVGHGQEVPTALTFIYTRCPLPEACPAMLGRLMALDARLHGQARIVAVTLDLPHDTVPVLAAYAAEQQLGPRFVLARAEREGLQQLAARAGMSILDDDGQIVHTLRMLVLDAEGRLVERYDDATFDLERVAGQLGG